MISIDEIIFKNLTSVTFGGEVVEALSGLGMLSISSKILFSFWSDIWTESKGSCPYSLNLLHKWSMLSYNYFIQTSHSFSSEKYTTPPGQKEGHLTIIFNTDK